MKTTHDIETFVPSVARMLNFKNEPKWVTLRFMINISLSVPRMDGEDYSVENMDGKEYRLVQITGEGKSADDHTRKYQKMIEMFDDVKIADKHALDKKLEEHVVRGYFILRNSLTGKSNIFEWLLKDFFE